MKNIKFLAATVASNYTVMHSAINRCEHSRDFTRQVLSGRALNKTKEPVLKLVKHRFFTELCQ